MRTPFFLLVLSFACSCTPDAPAVTPAVPAAIAPAPSAPPAPAPSAPPAPAPSAASAASPVDAKASCATVLSTIAACKGEPGFAAAASAHPADHPATRQLLRNFGADGKYGTADGRNIQCEMDLLNRELGGAGASFKKPAVLAALVSAAGQGCDALGAELKRRGGFPLTEEWKHAK